MNFNITIDFENELNYHMRLPDLAGRPDIFISKNLYCTFKWQNTLCY